ncbi:polysaccharide deacetylase family protein [Deinococcus deserti]|uniref:Putative polysaccharide deacetylase n=1 Tax=Deinococcus deserti (strain DSM 17065 / CIP 109153 / LMG 22923 / VCD115) TaxID=546414 RepID=C1CUS7_DEIDV|nr:polysaccharide deacetylase family protein [Deinococcus deserti]ACO45944.1 putative polysaccharide deacetylase [Deinococcus deserti VCD115]
MKRRALAALGGALLVYLGLPYLLVQQAGAGLIREGRRERRELTLTFDDGPDPVTTPLVLDALRDTQARATFFVIANRAEAHPDLIRRMLDEGHEVGAHAARHVHAWLRTPWDGFLDPARSARRIGVVTGQPVRFHRPPHGAYSLATVLGQRMAGLTGAHWSVEARDWDPAQSPTEVKERVLAQVTPGAVVVLHDAGPGARTTVPALPGLLTELHSRGYRCVPLGELDGAIPLDTAGLRRRLFIGLDAVYDRLHQVRPTEGRADNLFRTGRVTFPLHGVKLSNGTLIPQGIPAAEFHVNNPLLVDLGLRRSVRLAREDFRGVARDLRTRADLKDTQVVFCLSALSSLLAALGFETVDLPPADTRRLQRWANVLRRGYGSVPGAPQPKLSILSREAFLERYGD